jgi:putative restriction endonuclease
MNYYIGVTDTNWYTYLSRINPEDINFWKPGGIQSFKILQPGAPFLFKLKSPFDVIAGLGFYSSFSFLPLSVAWDTFGERNGCSSFRDLKEVILKYRQERNNSDPTIGCVILTNPIFFKQEDWISIPADWKSSIVQGKTYSTETDIGNSLWQRIDILLQTYLYKNSDEEKSQLILEEKRVQYGKPILTKVRLGQGAFRVLVTDAYNRKCAISNEKTLPVLEAAHIKSFSESGPHFISNGLLLRSDIHKLFDAGYVTITPNLKVEVSKKIKEEFENGREYYRFHGAGLLNLPSREMDKPNKQFIEWHNNIFKG